MPLLSVLIPSYNERKTILDILQKVVALPLIAGIEKEIIVVDDGSTDNTIALVEGFVKTQALTNLRLIVHEKNMGKGAGIRTGLRAAHGDYIIVQDADLEYDPQDYNTILAHFIANPALDVVYGSRRLGQREENRRTGRNKIIFNQKHPHSYTMAYIGGVAVTNFTNLCTGLHLTDEPTCYKTFKRHVIEAIDIDHNSFAWEPEITVKLARLGFTFAEVPIAYHPRKTTEGKKINWKDGLQALATILHYRLFWRPVHRQSPSPKISVTNTAT